MSIRTVLARKPPQQLVTPFLPTVSVSARASLRSLDHILIRSITTTRRVGQREPSALSRFFGLSPKQRHVDNPSRALRDAADTICVLLDTDPPVRLALLHKPYADLSKAVSVYRNTNVDPLDLMPTGTEKERTIVRLAGNSRTKADPLSYLSVLLQKLTSVTHSNSRDLELALRVHAEMQPLFGRTPTQDDILCVARARAMLRQPAEALEIAINMVPPPESHSEIWPLIACAAILASEDRGKNAADEIRGLIQKMAHVGVQPPPGAWCALLGTLRPEEVEAVLKVLPEAVSKEPRIWATALEVLLESENKKLRKEVAEKLEATVGTQSVTDTRVWAALVVYVGRVESQEDKNAPHEVLRAFDAAGGLPDSVLLAAFLRSLPLSERTSRTLRKLESEIGVPADGLAWGVIVDAVLERIETQVEPETEDTGVVGVWATAAESGVNLTSTVLDRVLTREDIPIVDRLWVYKAVNAAWPAEKDRDKVEEEPANEIDKWMRREDALTVPGPTVRTYSALLRALVSQKGKGLNKTAASAAAVEVLTDMRQRGIKFPQIAQVSTLPPRSGKTTRQTATPILSPLASLAILLMENAPSHEAAFKTYAYASVIDPSSGSFGEREYRAILKAFAGLKVLRDGEQLLREGGAGPWGESISVEAILGRRTEVYAPPPAALYYEIMRDMQRAGYAVQSPEYSTILRAYANSCLAPPDEYEPTSNETSPNRAGRMAASAELARAHNSYVLEHIQRIHTLLKLDTNLTPDTGLLNSLMLAYGHAGALDNVLAIWDQIRDRGWDNASVSIVIDALGRSGRANLGQARRLWDTLRRRNGPRLTVNNYSTWVEALCRLGEFAEAERVVFIDMRGNIKPDEKTLRTLVSFAWRTGRQAQVLQDVRREFPNVI